MNAPKVGDRIGYRDIANPLRVGTVAEVLDAPKYGGGPQYRVEFDDGTETTSDCRQHGWSAVPESPKVGDVVDDPGGLWDGAEYIAVYTRAQALADGELVAVDGDLAREAGFVVPVAMTARVARIVAPNDAEAAEGQDRTGRMWDVLNLARLAARRTDGPSISFHVYFVMRRPDEYPAGRSRRGAKPFPISLRMTVGPGDAGEPVITFMTPEED